MVLARGITAMLFFCISVALFFPNSAGNHLVVCKCRFFLEDTGSLTDERVLKSTPISVYVVELLNKKRSSFKLELRVDMVFFFFFKSSTMM